MQMSSTSGKLLRFYVHQNRQHGQMAMYEWLLQQARAMGIHGGSAFRAIAGYGRRGRIDEEHFFELSAELTIAVEFVVSGADAERLLDLVRRERIDIFYACAAAEFGIIDGNR